MNVSKLKKQLKKEFPDSNIISNTNSEGEVVEIVIELESDGEKSRAIAIIDRSPEHFHKVLTETYKVLKGELKVDVDGQKVNLKEGEQFEIKPNQRHYAIGDETWVEVISTPPWSVGDYFLV